MQLILSKTIFAGSIFALTLLAGLLPLHGIMQRSPRLSSISDAFASGVFLGTALLHLLPDAVAKFQDCYQTEYPIAYLICIAACILFLLTERWLYSRHPEIPAGCQCSEHTGFRKPGELADDHPTSQHRWAVPLSLITLLTVHSLIEGAAIGANQNWLEAVTIFIAVFAHKGSESFALASKLNGLALPPRQIRRIITLFSFVTPCGIFIASYLAAITISSSGGTIIATFNAVAAGTFLYLSTEHLIEGKKSFEQLYEVAALIAGVMIMALVAYYV